MNPKPLLRNPNFYTILYFIAFALAALFLASSCTPSRIRKPGTVYLTKSQQRMGKTNIFTGEYVRFKK